MTVQLFQNVVQHAVSNCFLGCRTLLTPTVVIPGLLVERGCSLLGFLLLFPSKRTRLGWTAMWLARALKACTSFALAI